MSNKLKGLLPSTITIIGCVLLIQLFGTISKEKMNESTNVSKINVIVKADNETPRFVKINEESTSNSITWHDRQTGQEVICFYGGGVQSNPSCYLTGRKW